MVTQGLFKRNGEFVAVKRFRLGTDDYLEPGQSVDRGRFRLYHIQSLFRRRIIGYKDSQWSKNMIESYISNNPQLKPEVVSVAKKKPTKKIVEEEEVKPTKKPRKNVFADTLTKD